MRRANCRMPEGEALRTLAEAGHGFLGTCGPHSVPYVVPVIHAYDDGCIIIHCATDGHKLDNIRLNDHVCFSVCLDQEVVPERLSTRYRSVIAFGRAEIVTEPELKRALLQKLLDRLAPGRPFSCSDAELRATGVIRIHIERLTGKWRSGLD